MRTRQHENSIKDVTDIQKCYILYIFLFNNIVDYILIGLQSS